jgi:alanine transaminase
LEEFVCAIAKAKKDGIQIRAAVVTNPGNPTGHVLTADELADILRICEKESIVVIADEIY